MAGVDERYLRRDVTGKKLGSAGRVATQLLGTLLAVAEKTPCWLRLTATGRAGHGSAPPQETAVTKLVRALERLRVYQPPLHVTPEVQAYYAALAQTQTGARRGRYRNLRNALTADASFRQEFLTDPHNAALVRNTITPTVLTGSHKTNVIPPSAAAELDCRLLSGEDPNAFVRTVGKRIADPDVHVDVLLNFPPSSSPTDNAMVAAVRALAAYDEAPVVPGVLTGFTDSHYFPVEISSWVDLNHLSEAEIAWRTGPERG